MKLYFTFSLKNLIKEDHEYDGGLFFKKVKRLLFLAIRREGNQHDPADLIYCILIPKARHR